MQKSAAAFGMLGQHEAPASVQLPGLSLSVYSVKRSGEGAAESSRNSGDNGSAKRPPAPCDSYPQARKAARAAFSQDASQGEPEPLCRPPVFSNPCIFLKLYLKYESLQTFKKY